MSQEETILNHLKEKGSITPLEALNRFGVFRLAARINRLRDEGHSIKTEIVTSKGKSFAKYELQRVFRK